MRKIGPCTTAVTREFGALSVCVTHTPPSTAVVDWSLVFGRTLQHVIPGYFAIAKQQDTVWTVLVLSQLRNKLHTALSSKAVRRGSLLSIHGADAV